MESHSNLPPATGTNFHITNAAVNNDALINHPPYNEMITAAFIAMKERGGSSRQAIAKYIESEYKNLSPCHATLLTQQLRKMKNQGQLILNKHSFMLSGGNSQSFVKGSVVRKRRPGRPPKIPSSGGGVGGVASPSVSCVSGLPVISAPSVMVGAVPMVVPMGEVDGETPVKRRPGGPPTLQTIVAEVEPGAGTETVSVGRRLGRPPKNNNGIVGVGTGGGGSVLGKRGRRCVVMEAAIVSASLGNSDDVEWGCGRPYKIGAVSSSGHSDGGAILVPIEGMGGAGRASEIDARRPTKQSEDNKAAPIALGGLREVGGIPMMCAPVSKIELRDQGGPGRDPVEPLCAQYQKFCI